MLQMKLFSIYFSYAFSLCNFSFFFIWEMLHHLRSCLVKNTLRNSHISISFHFSLCISDGLLFFKKNLFILGVTEQKSYTISKTYPKFVKCMKSAGESGICDEIPRIEKSHPHVMCTRKNAVRTYL